MKLYIKYMVSLRCKMLVKDELKRLNIEPISIELGVVDCFRKISQEERQLLADRLLLAGLELLDDKRVILIERIKSLIVEMVHYDAEEPKMNYSAYIQEKIGYDYTYLSNIFSEVKGINIQQFIIYHKIERVKELLLYEELNLTEIAFKLHYSSVAHLSTQFKKVTGLTPSYFKQLKQKRTGLEQVGEK